MKEPVDRQLLAMAIHKYDLKLASLRDFMATQNNGALNDILTALKAIGDSPEEWHQFVSSLAVLGFLTGFIASREGKAT